MIIPFEITANKKSL